MSFKFNLLTTEKEIEKAIQESINSILPKLIRTAYNNTIRDIGNLIRAKISSSELYADIAADSVGSLKGDLGLLDGQSRLDAIIDVWVANIAQQSIITKDGFEINAIKADYTDVLSAGAAHFVTPENYYGLEWLKWLLLMGNSVVVTGAKIVRRQGTGRTGLAVMATKGKSSGGTYSIPDRWQGTISDNFVTKSIEDTTNEIRDIMIKNLEEAINGV